MLPVKPMNIQDYFAPADGSSKIASYFELEAALKAQASATPTQTIQQTSNPVEVKSTPKTNTLKEVKPNGDLKWLVIGTLVALSAIAYFAYHKHKNDDV
jgi:hypothetical protein